MVSRRAIINERVKRICVNSLMIIKSEADWTKTQNKINILSICNALAKLETLSYQRIFRGRSNVFLIQFICSRCKSCTLPTDEVGPDWLLSSLLFAGVASVKIRMKTATVALPIHWQWFQEICEVWCSRNHLKELRILLKENNATQLFR